MTFCNVLVGDCREVLATLAAGSAQTCVTSPPYFGLRDYGTGDRQIGLEPTPAEFVEALVAVFREVRRVLADDGTLWLDLGDSYAVNGGARGYGSADNFLGRGAAPERRRRAPEGIKAKDLIGIPWMTALALRADGWFLRSEIIWAKPNCMPESVGDRPTRAHEQIFLLSKQSRYFYAADAIREPHSREWWNESVGEPYMTAQDGRNDGGKRQGTGDAAGRNKRSVWTVASQPYEGAHFATFPPNLIEPCVLAGSRAGDTVLDPFNGAGTTGLVALGNGRSYVGIEINPEYAQLARDRLLGVDQPLPGLAA